MKKVFKKDFVLLGETLYKKDDICDSVIEEWCGNNNNVIETNYVDDEWYVADDYFYTIKELRQLKLLKLKHTRNENR